ncbi:CYFA0S11e02080g1_1 [Cyberlindnera fabianii]|uniref:CYFA0S11e02080g1_1 n=1 Tax=Cyberlindnera fabianii TaxID=36022 RepID=A0A061B6C3_CYBFA|nr:Protein KRE1 [Cyberlindnera fabianii]CDR43233.1 CYFA0S11e02080g1_1 [Cyberlindnera fabianii]
MKLSNVITSINKWLLLAFILSSIPQANAAEEATTTLETTKLTGVTATTSTSTSTQTPSPTLVWATGTDANGVLATTQSPYTQIFKSMYSTIQTPPAGSIGLGTIKGTIGHYRTRHYITVTVD